MGGSRRKVTSTRMSTQKRQKHYFEQKRRQQQATGGRKDSEEHNIHGQHAENSRSLDILSFQNLSTVVQQNKSNYPLGLFVFFPSPTLKGLRAAFFFLPSSYFMGNNDGACLHFYFFYLTVPFPGIGDPGQLSDSVKLQQIFLFFYFSSLNIKYFLLVNYNFCATVRSSWVSDFK